MIANWIYNKITNAAEKEGNLVNLDAILDKMGTGSAVSLTENHPTSVSVNKEERFYIKPTLTDISTVKEPKLFLFSAPGATGKSALAYYISLKKNAVLWDLAKEHIANHSLSGMLVESLGTQLFSQFTKGLVDGNAVLVIDALDEAEMISGRIALETLLIDLRNMLKDAKCATVALCSRTETAHYISNFYSKDDHKLPISQFEIGFFEESNANDFVLKKIAEDHDVTQTTKECVVSQFNLIKSLLNGDDEAIKSFLGYAPVLEALAVSFDEDANTLHLLQEIKSAKNSTEIFARVMNCILEREQGKVINGFMTRCQNDYPDFKEWNSVYTVEEQIAHIANYLVFDEVEVDACPKQLPRELKTEYIESIKSFIKDHPFIRCFSCNGDPYNDFTGPAFRDYTLARLMTMSEYDIYAREYFTTHKKSARFPSQLFFDFYNYYSGGKTVASHFSYLYDAFKSKETANTLSSVSLEQVGDVIFCTFVWKKEAKVTSEHVVELVMEETPQTGEGITITQLNNAYVDINSEVTIGEFGGDAIINNSTIKCKKINVQAQYVLIEAYNPGETVIVLDEGIDIKRNPAAKFEIQTDTSDYIKISTPDIDDWYKLRPYKYEFNDDTKTDITKFENAVKTILKHFRKHGKDAPGRHREYIRNIIIGGSQLKQNVFEFFKDRKIIYEDDKDLSQCKLNNTALESLGVNWGGIAQNASLSSLTKVYEAYCAWLVEKKA